MHQNQNKHKPVLSEEVLTHLKPKTGETYLDLTAGYGGHASQVLEITKNAKESVLVDRDKNAINHLEEKFQSGIRILHTDFLSASEQLAHEGRTFDLILADLGVSSPHLDNIERGFSFTSEAPLDMRMDSNQEKDAYQVVNSYKVDKLAKILKDYGQEPKAYKLAQLIVKNRPVKTTIELANLAKKIWPGRSKVHPATRLFQAIRIEVNDELSQLEQALPLWFKLLSPGGRIVVISFHSLEDRMVKQAIKDVSGNRYDAVLKPLTAKPVTASADELVFNPRARSAKLRAAVKIKSPHGSK